MLQDFQRHFSHLPLKGQVRETKNYWSSDYWALNKGSINLRWNSQNPQGFNTRSPGFSDALRMSLSDLKSLSPAEKFDLLNGHYTYPLKASVAKRASPRRKDWEGMCHGWAAAALNHPEPVPRTITNPDGIIIPFGSSDIKALLSYYYAYVYEPVSTHQMGRRCRGNEFCDQDMNAGAFHIVLSNLVGIRGKGFISDIEPGKEVWNHLAYRYETKVLSQERPAMDSAPGTRVVVRVRTSFKVVFNIAKNSWEPVQGTPQQTFRDLLFDYELDLDSQEKIIGGKWLSKSRVDFVWTMAKVRTFQKPFANLPRLLNER
jgi:hypothetical protein